MNNESKLGELEAAEHHAREAFMASLAAAPDVQKAWREYDEQARPAREARERREEAMSQFKAAGVVAAIVVLGIGWYLWVKNDWDHADTWGSIGDAVGPFTGLATALALGFAVYATMLQRKELKLQRDEMRAQREEMALQRAEAAKAAAAQERLAQSQERLAQAQEVANELQREEMKAQREEAARDAEARRKLVDSLSALTDAQRSANALAKEGTKAQKANNMAVAAAAQAELEITLARTDAGGKQFDNAVREATRKALPVLRGIVSTNGEWRTSNDAPQREKK